MLPKEANTKPYRLWSCQHFQAHCFFLLNRGRIEVQFKICGVNGIGVYKSWSESKLLKWWFSLFGCCCCFEGDNICKGDMRNSNLLSRCATVLLLVSSFQQFLRSLACLLSFSICLSSKHFATKMLPSHLLYALYSWCDVCLCHFQHAPKIFRSPSVMLLLFHVSEQTKRSFFRTSAFLLMLFHEFNC